jgi:indole-3-glycerol phosphate synthase
MNRVLEQIIEATRADLEREPINLASFEKKARIVVDGSRPHRFREQLSLDGIRMIAEIKAASPSAGTIVNDPDVEVIAREYAAGGAAALSIVTEPHFFKGSRSWLRRAAVASALPVIMKDFIISEAQIVRGVAAGADAILLLASVLDTSQIRGFLQVCEEYGRDALVEVHDAPELLKATDAGARIIGVNNRDLRTFDVSLGTAESVGPMIPPGIIRVSESGIGSRDDIERLGRAGFKAFLVGEALMRSHDRTAALRELIGSGIGVNQ